MKESALRGARAPAREPRKGSTFRVRIGDISGMKIFPAMVVTLLLMPSPHAQVPSGESEARTYAIPDELRLRVPESETSPFLVVGDVWQYLEEELTKWVKENAGVELGSVTVTNPANAVITDTAEVHAKLTGHLRALPDDIQDTLVAVRVHVIAAKDVRAANRLLEMTTMAQIFGDEDLEVQSTLASRISLIGRSVIENTTEFIYPTEDTSPEAPESPSTAKAFEMRPIGTTVGIDGYWDGALGKMQYALEHLVFVGFADYGNGAGKSVLQPVFQSWRCSVEAHLDGSLVIAGGGRIPRPVIPGETKEEAAQSGDAPAHLYFAVEAEAIPHREIVR